MFGAAPFFYVCYIVYMEHFWIGFEKRASEIPIPKTPPPWASAKKIMSWAPNPGRSVAGMSREVLNKIPVAPTSARSALRRSLTGAMAKLGNVPKVDVAKAKSLFPQVLAHFDPRPGVSRAGISIKGLKNMAVSGSTPAEVATRHRVAMGIPRPYGVPK
jgi:hypothetical protein